MLPLPKQFAQWPGEASSVTLPRPRVAKQVRAVSVPGGTAWGPIGSPGSHAGPLLSAALNLPPPTPAKGSGSGRGGGRGRSTGPHKARAGRGEAEAALSQNRALRGRGAQARSRKPARPPQERPRRPQRGDTHCRTTVRAKRFISPAAEAGDAAGRERRPTLRCGPLPRHFRPRARRRSRRARLLPASSRGDQSQRREADRSEEIGESRSPARALARALLSAGL